MGYNTADILKDKMDEGREMRDEKVTSRTCINWEIISHMHTKIGGLHGITTEVKKHYGKLKQFINGEWVKPESGKYFETTNPATGEVIAEAPVASLKEVDRTISAAHEAFKKWRNVPFRIGRDSFLT